MMDFTASTFAEHPKDTVRLWAAKPPLAGESLASWIQRLCGEHQYSFQVLGRVLGFRPYRGDWDRQLDVDAWRRLVGLVDFPGLIPSYGEMALLGAMSRAAKSGSLMQIVDNKPAYRWCPACLADDETPHLRWYWRLDAVRECWVHQTPLSEKCLVCGQALFLHRARLTGRCASSLSECADCGMSLSAPVGQEAQEANYDREMQHKLRSLFEPWWLSGGGLPNLDIAERLASKYHYVVRDRRRLATARFQTNLKRRDKLLKQANSWVLDASSFQQSATVVREKPVTLRAPWQWKLNPMRRLAVAEALWSIRCERRANQGGAEASP